MADSVWLSVHTINLDNSDVVLIELKVLRCKGSHVDDSEEIFLAWSDTELDILRLIDQDRVWHWFCSIVVVRVVLRLVIVDQTRSLGVIQISESHDIFRIDTIWSVYIIDDERTSESIDVLSTNVCMVPVCSGLRDFELIDEACSGLDWTLSNHCWSIGECSILLEDTVEMDGRTLVDEVIRHSKLDGVAHVD